MPKEDLSVAYFVKLKFCILKQHGKISKMSFNNNIFIAIIITALKFKEKEW